MAPLLLFGAQRPWVEGLLQALRREGEEVQLRPAEMLADMRQTRAAVAELRPRAAVMLPAAGDAQDPDTAFRVNTEAPMNLAMATMEFGATPVLLVPSGVAAGLRRPPAEFDPIPGLSSTADSLLRGERFLLRASPQALILRCGPLLNPAEVRARLREGVVASPERNVCPLSVDQLARAISRALAAGLRGHLHPLSQDARPISELSLWQELAAAYGDPAPRAGASPAVHAALRTERSEELGTLGSWRSALLPPPPEPPPAPAPTTDKKNAAPTDGNTPPALGRPSPPATSAIGVQTSETGPAPQEPAAGRPETVPAPAAPAPGPPRPAVELAGPPRPAVELTGPPAGPSSSRVEAASGPAAGPPRPAVELTGPPAGPPRASAALPGPSSSRVEAASGPAAGPPRPAVEVEEVAVAGACGAVRCCRLTEGSVRRVHPGAWLLRVVAGKLWVERGEEDQILKPGGSLRLEPGDRLVLHARGPVAWIELDDPSPP